MKINGYSTLINRLFNADGRQKEITREHEKVASPEKKDAAGIADAVQQELEKAGNGAREAKLTAIAAQLQNGTYEVDTLKLAEAMLGKDDE